jgi:hypothetical protein
MQDASIVLLIVCSHLLAAVLREKEPFRTTDHLAVIHAVKDELKYCLTDKRFMGPRNGLYLVIDVRVTDTDTKSNLSKDPAKVLATHEREKKKKYLEACLGQRRHFTPFVVSTDGLIGREAKILWKKLSALLAAKWEKPRVAMSTLVGALPS